MELMWAWTVGGLENWKPKTFMLLPDWTILPSEPKI